MPIKDMKQYCLDDFTFYSPDNFKHIRKDIDMAKKIEGVYVSINDAWYVVPEVSVTSNYGEMSRVTIHGNINVAPQPTIKDVIFNPPATIVFWSDNTKTVVKADGDIYDPEKGIAMAISRKMIGDNKREYYNIFRHYLKKYYKQYPHTIDDYFVPGEY